MDSRGLEPGAVEALRSIALRFGSGYAAAKARALSGIASLPVTDAAVLLAYHDCLLCLVAYPETRALRTAARRELRRVAAAAQRIFAAGPARERAKLANSGVASTDVTINFGWDIARWLVERFASRADIDSFGEDGLPPQEILGPSLPPMEFDLCARDLSPLEFVAEAGAGRRGTGLAWLAAAFAELQCTDALRAALWDAMRPFIVIRPGRTMLSRTFARGLPARTFYHRDELPRRIDLPALLDVPLPPPRRLSRADRQHVIDTGRGMLAALGRETDAIALAAPGGVRYYDLPRGTALALYTIRPERRAPLDSHIGMMLFKNGVPVGYGGGWPFLGTCRIGVNIFAPFRGGESALLFGQVLRVYRQCFGIGRFVAEPSQFGGSNIEGLRSGAFWFYYRLGFRPVEPDAARRADEEWSRMRADPHHRTPLARLRRFTDSDIELRIEPVPEVETGDLSELVSRWIGARFDGDRGAAQQSALRSADRALGTRSRARWPTDEQQSFAALAPLVAQLPKLAGWPATDKRRLVLLLRTKGRDEFRFHDRLRRHRRLCDALVELGSAARR